jgi:hypothetical protein
MSDYVNISDYPKQSKTLYHRVKVYFNNEILSQKKGTIIRDDREEPFETIIKLDDGRIVRGSECQFLYETD